MKFVYVDESGDSGQSRFLAFFGLHVDAYRLKKVMRDSRKLFSDIEAAFPEALPELKTSRLVNGKGGWRRVDIKERLALFERLCGFVAATGCHGATYLLDSVAYEENKALGLAPAWAGTRWLSSATTIALVVQLQNQGSSNNKGLSVLVFDDNRSELPVLTQFLTCSCDSADEYYKRKKKAEPFDHIVDTAFAIRSEHSTLVQISDACSYALRRCAELEVAGDEEEWVGERHFIRHCVALFAPRVFFPPGTWVRTPSCDDAKWIRDVAIDNFKDWVRS